METQNWKGRCFEAAYIQASDLIRRGLTDVRIVHGAPEGRGALRGRRIGHAWVEHDGAAYDLTIGLVCPVELYYLIGKMTEAHVKRYTMREWVARAARAEHYGPWEEPALSAEGA